MTTRDRMVVIAVALIVVIAGGWILVVSPERKQASQLDAQVGEAKAQLSSAEQQLANARSAEAQYSTAYAAIVSLGKAVPPSEEVPSLIYQLSIASSKKNVGFNSIVSGSGASTSTASAASAAGAAAAVSAGFTQMPFTFVFEGSFFDLEHLFQQLNRFTARTANGGLAVTGRLLTIKEVKLSPIASAGGEHSGTQNLTGTISASAYVLPASQGLTGGASPGAPAGTSTPASSTGSASSPAAPAVVKVTP